MEWSDWITAVATVAAAIIALIGLVIAARATRVNAAISQRNQQSNVILHCSLRYDNLYEMRGSLGELDQLLPDQDVRTAESQVQNYFHRYFGLESDQIDFWLSGYVDPETLFSWLTSLADNLYQRNVGGYTYISGWRFVENRHRVINQTLYFLVDEIIKFETHLKEFTAKEREIAIAGKIEALMKQAERSQAKLIWRFSDTSGRRFSAEEFESYLDTSIQEAIVKIENGSRP